LSPQYLPTVPGDPFDAERPFKYRKAAGAYVLYSVGPDGKDDHGRPIPRRGGARSTYALADSIGDIVAGVVN